MIHNITGKDSRVYKDVFIDLDGTITESGEGCMNAARYMFKKAGYEENDEVRIRAFVGPPVKHHLINAYGFPEEEAARIYAYYREYYLSKGMYESRLYNGIEDALCNLLLEPDHMADLLQVLLDYKMSYARALVENLRPQVMLSHDDWGTMSCMFMSPDIWRRFFKPLYAELYGYLKQNDVQVMDGADCY